MLKKTASSVLAILLCSHTPCTLRASKWLRPRWTEFFEHSLQLKMAVSSWAFICHESERFNDPLVYGWIAESAARKIILHWLNQFHLKNQVDVPLWWKISFWGHSGTHHRPCCMVPLITFQDEIVW